MKYTLIIWALFLGTNTHIDGKSKELLPLSDDDTLKVYNHSGIACCLTDKVTNCEKIEYIIQHRETFQKSCVGIQALSNAFPLSVNMDSFITYTNNRCEYKDNEIFYKLINEISCKNNCDTIKKWW